MQLRPHRWQRATEARDLSLLVGKTSLLSACGFRPSQAAHHRSSTRGQRPHQSSLRLPHLRDTTDRTDRKARRLPRPSDVVLDPAATQDGPQGRSHPNRRSPSAPTCGGRRLHPPARSCDGRRRGGWPMSASPGLTFIRFSEASSHPSWCLWQERVSSTAC